MADEQYYSRSARTQHFPIQNIDLIDIIIGKEDDEKLIRFFNEMLKHNYNPDINGYTFLFMVPPDLSGLRIKQDYPNSVFRAHNSFQGINEGTLDLFLRNICKFVTFAAVDFSPPQEQVNTEKISTRSGAIPYATEFTTSEQLSVTYIDNTDLSIYNFHQIWMHYIWDILEGKIKPAPEYLDVNTHLDESGWKGGYYQCIDYAASIYVVKYRPDMKTITYIGKCIGVFPQSLPSKELIGTRTSNELTTIPFSYFCAAYRSEVTTQIDQNNPGDNYWILKEFMKHVLTKF
jgi:hypothetical protein